MATVSHVGSCYSFAGLADCLINQQSSHAKHGLESRNHPTTAETRRWWERLEEHSSDESYSPGQSEPEAEETDDEAEETEDEAEETEDEAEETEDEAEETVDEAEETVDEAERTNHERQGGARKPAKSKPAKKRGKGKQRAVEILEADIAAQGQTKKPREARITWKDKKGTWGAHLAQMCSDWPEFYMLSGNQTTPFLESYAQKMWDKFDWKGVPFGSVKKVRPRCCCGASCTTY